VKTKEDRMAERGAKFLDRRIPHWRKLVVRADFNIGDGEFCILGHIFGRAPTDTLTAPLYGYERGLRALGLTERAAETLGFQPDGDEDGLQRAWRRLLRRRG